jgi:hypothetical protein
VHVRPGTRLIAALAIAVSALVLAAPVEAKKLRFRVISLEGKQTATWNDKISSGCGEISRNGSQTISFESTRTGKLALQRIPRYTRAGKRNGFTYSGVTFVRSGWTFDRTFSQGPQPQCPAEPAQNPDCGRRGPFPAPVNILWRDGAIELRAVTSEIRAGYGTCEYNGFHEADLIDSKGRLSQRRLTHRRGRLRVRISGRVKEPSAESEGSQTTSLTAILTLKRMR